MANNMDINEILNMYENLSKENEEQKRAIEDLKKKNEALAKELRFLKIQIDGFEVLEALDKQDKKVPLF